MSLLRRPRRYAGVLALALPAALLAAPSGAVAPDATAASFDRINVDTAVRGASFTVVGEVFAGEQNIVTSGFGALGPRGAPSGGGSLQIYRPRANLADWQKVSVFDATANIIFPNQPTLSDVDGDGDTDVIVPSGNFFDSFAPPPAPAGNSRGALTWWENTGLAANGTPNPFVRHDVVTGQPWSYHGVQHVDLDGDGIKDLVSVGEQGLNPSDQTDDQVETHFFRGTGGTGFAAPVVLADVGGSLPVVHDVDADGDRDIVTAQYFDFPGQQAAGKAAFLWLEQVPDGTPGLSAGDFTPRTIATLAQTGMGFQIRPVPGFRGPGTVSWIGTNHTNRCLQPYLPAERVMEFVPPADPRQPWAVTTLSNPATPAPACPADYTDGTVPIFPGDEITSRPTNGQGAPGVFGYGDVDGDGDIDLAVSGDGDRRLFWIEQLAGGATRLHTLTSPGEQFGQSGGGAVADLNGDGTAELVFSSFDRDTVAIWKRRPQAPAAPPGPVAPGPGTTTVTSALRVTPASTRVAAGRKAQWKVRLTGARGGSARQVKVTFLPARGKARVVRTLRLRSRTATTRQAVLTWRPTRSGRLRVDYAGTVVSNTLRDTATRAQVRIRVGGR
ncbi:FG-GAP repeat domain-containing protein [Nocardioides pantholopis]|uniref:FG-GAP repeat domain-containing protein n=1 Tax=Nocardioides pantholopis TaxID=2483798 RepID=UPI000F07CE19|nr:VCBS repeat-containing protein [Nocardioides pantholopis]